MGKGMGDKAWQGKAVLTHFPSVYSRGRHVELIGRHAHNHRPCFQVLKISLLESVKQCH